jgi:hypothetical protein
MVVERSRKWKHVVENLAVRGNRNKETVGQQGALCI